MFSGAHNFNLENAPWFYDSDSYYDNSDDEED